jgi:saccharopine dehydrogenase (NAD+, L-lysine forming)
VNEIVTGWSLGGAVVEGEPAYPAGGSAAAAVEHCLIQLSGTIRVWRDGIEQEVAPLEPADLDYPGIGPVRTYTIGHPKAVTLPRYVDGVVTSMNVTSGPEWLIDHAWSVAAAYDAGTITLAEGAVQLGNPRRPAERAPRDPLGSVWALARGERDGQPLAVPSNRIGGPPGRWAEDGCSPRGRTRAPAPGQHQGAGRACSRRRH